MSVPNNYNIINQNIKDFYSDIFLNDIDEITNQLKNKVKTEKIFQNKNIKKDDVEKHKELMITNYIIPLTYLIYSYIYIKFYNNQFKNQIAVENKLNYEMYKFVFSHKNPIIRKVNIFLYKYYKDQLHGDKKIDFTIDDVKNTTMKDNTIKFIEDMNNVLKDDTKDLNILKNIHDNLNKAENRISDIIIIINEIIRKYNETLQQQQQQLPLFNNENIYKKINDFSIKKIDIVKFKIIESEYNNFYTSYLELIKTNIKTININILKLNDIDENNIIHEDKIYFQGININGIKSIEVIKTIYTTIYTQEKEKYDNYKIIIQHNIELNQLLNKGKKLINLFFSIDISKLNKKMNEIVKNIKNNKEAIITKIYAIISLIVKAQTSLKIDEIMSFINTNDTSSNKLLEQYIYIYRSIIYYEIIEFNYLFKKNNTHEDAIYDDYNNENYFKEQRKKFYELFENYIDDITKNNKSKNSILNNIKDDYILKKENLINDKNIIEERSIQYIKKTQNITNKLTKIEIEIKKLENTKNDCIKKQKEISSLILRSGIIESRKRIMDIINNLPYLKENFYDKISSIIDNINDNSLLKSEVNTFFVNTIINELTNSITQFQLNKSDLTTKEKESIIKNKEYDEIQKNIIDTILSNIGIETNNNNSKQNYFNTINKVIKNIDSEKNQNEKNVFLDKCNSEFDILDKILKEIDDKITIMDFSRTDNKLFFLYEKDSINKTYKYYFSDLVGNKKDLFNKFESTLNNPDKIFLRKNMKLKVTNLITDIDINIHFMNKIIIDLNKYFIENKEDFFKKFTEIFNNNENNNLVSFLDQYKKYKDDLILKINNLLDKINNNELKLIDNTKLDSNNLTNNFLPKIQKKQDRINKIKEHQNDKTDKRGKYTIIIPSTDVLFLYIINLLIIIDFLTYFYE